MMVLNFHSDQHRETPIDIFVAEPFEFESEYRRALVEEVAPAVPLHIVSYPTLVKMKRDAGRTQDLADVEELRRLLGDPSDD
jgi:hypothetical protein